MVEGGILCTAVGQVIHRDHRLSLVMRDDVECGQHLDWTDTLGVWESVEGMGRWWGSYWAVEIGKACTRTHPRVFKMSHNFSIVQRSHPRSSFNLGMPI
jgi:hypothetical protein